MTDEVNREGVPTWIPFPFSHAQAAALLQKNGFNAEFWDGVAEGGTLDSYLQRVISWSPDLYIQEVVAPTYPYDMEIFQRLRSALPRTVLAVAGTMITAWGKEMLVQNPVLDAGLTFEWEETALALAEAEQTQQTFFGISR